MAFIGRVADAVRARFCDTDSNTAPLQEFSPYGQLLTKLLGAGFDMKCRDDYTQFVLPVLQDCGGSVQAIASSIGTNVSGGLSGPESFAARKAAYGHNRIPQKPMVSLCLFSSLFLPRASPGSSLLAPQLDLIALCRKRSGSSPSSPFKTPLCESSAPLPSCP